MSYKTSRSSYRFHCPHQHLQELFFVGLFTWLQTFLVFWVVCCCLLLLSVYLSFRRHFKIRLISSMGEGEVICEQYLRERPSCTQKSLSSYEKWEQKRCCIYICVQCIFQGSFGGNRLRFFWVNDRQELIQDN